MSDKITSVIPATTSFGREALTHAFNNNDKALKKSVPNPASQSYFCSSFTPSINVSFFSKEIHLGSVENVMTLRPKADFEAMAKPNPIAA